MRSVTRRGLMGLVVGLAALTTTVAAATPASADPVSVTCPAGNAVVTYSPPLTYTQRDTTITVHRELGTCAVSPNPQGITTGYMDWAGTFPASCNMPVVPVTVTDEIVWTAGQTTYISHVTMNSSSTIVNGVLMTVFTGSVTSGLFAGSTLVMSQPALVADPLACLTTGLASQYVPLLTLQITST